MAEIIHSTTVSKPGPWLIEREKLLELDKLFETEWQKLLERRERLINEGLKKFISDRRESLRNAGLEKQIPENAELEKEFRRVERVDDADSYHYGRKHSLVIFLKGHRRIEVDTFGDAFRQTALLNECPIGFELIMKACDVELWLYVQDDEDPTYLTGPNLRLKVTPDTDDTAKGLFSTFKTWVDDCKPPIWQTIWLNSRFILLTCSVAFGAISVFSFIHKWPKSQSPTEILLDGVFCFGVLLTFIPKVIIGIGKGDNVIKRWKKWMTFLVIGTPTWIIGNFILPPIIENIKALFP